VDQNADVVLAAEKGVNLEVWHASNTAEGRLVVGTG
jgi:hypothetical protein